MNRKASVKTSAFFFLLCLIITTSSCSLQPQPSLDVKTVELTDFSNIYLNTPGTVTISMGDANSISIVSQPQILQNIRYQVSENTLWVDLSDTLTSTSLNPEQAIQIQITARDVNRIQLYGAGSLVISGLTGDLLTLQHRAVSDVEIDDLNIRFLVLDLNGSGTITARGTVQEQIIQMSGSVQYHALDLRTSSVTATLSDYSNATISVEQSLSVNAGPNAHLTYQGSPQVILLEGSQANITSID